MVICYSKKRRLCSILLLLLISDYFFFPEIYRNINYPLNSSSKYPHNSEDEITVSMEVQEDDIILFKWNNSRESDVFIIDTYRYYPNGSVYWSELAKMGDFDGEEEIPASLKRLYFPISFLPDYLEVHHYNFYLILFYLDLHEVDEEPFGSLINQQTVSLLEDDYENETPQYIFKDNETDTEPIDVDTENEKDPIWPYFFIGGAIIIAFLGYHKSLNNKKKKQLEPEPRDTKTKSLDRWKSNFKKIKKQ